MGNIDRAYGGPAVPTNSSGTPTRLQVTCGSGTVDVPGSWYELAASTQFDMAGFYLVLYLPTGFRITADIGIGASGSEVVLVDELLVEYYTTSNRNCPVQIPINIPKGSRLSVRGANRSTGSSVTFYAKCHGYGMGALSPSSFQVMEHIGRVVVVPGVDPSWGSYAEISSSIPQNYKSFIIGMDNNLQNAVPDYTIKYELALGAAASEVAILGEVIASMDAVDDMVMMLHQNIFPMCLPQGERLSARAYTNITTGDEDKGFHVWGLR